MPFYNKGPVTVVPYAPNAGSGVYPLEVVSVGGLSFASASIGNNAGEAILAAPANGQAYRLQRWGIALGEGIPAYTGGAASISDTFGEIDAHLVQLSSTTVAGEGWPLHGQLALSAVSVFNLFGETLTFYVRYDVINIPHIQ